MNDEQAESNNEEKQDPPAEEFVAELVEAELVDEGTDTKDAVDPTAARAVPYDPSILRNTEGAIVAAVPAVVAYNPSVLAPPKADTYLPPPSPMANLAAKGGAVGAIVLGVLSFIGSFITSYAILNSFLGVALGLWGLRSNHRRMAMIGMGLCLLSGFFCVLDISEWMQSLWSDPEFE